MKTSPSLWQILCDARFFPYYCTQFLRVLNDNLFKNALVMIFTFKIGADAGYDTATLLSLQAAIFILPFFLFSTLAGQLADKYNKSLIARRVKMLEIVLAAIGGGALIFNHVEILLAVLFGFGLLAAFFGPVKYSIIPDLIDRRDLLAGNSLVEAGTLLGVLLGTIAGGLIPSLPYGEYFAAALVLAVAVIGYWSSTRMPDLPPYTPHLKISYSILADTWRLIAATKKYPAVWRAILCISWFWFIGAAYVTYLPTLAKEELGANQEVVTVFYVLFSIGIAIGSILCHRVLRGAISIRLVAVSAAALSLASLHFWWGSHNFPMPAELIGIRAFLGYWQGWALMFDMLALAIAGGMYIVPLYTVLQHKSPDDSRARMIAANNILNAIFMVATAALSLWLIQMAIPVSAVLGVYGIVNLGVAAWVKLRWKTADI
jgi:acyl-[acyl-carrier-protein]-phospholipid O-acyltransferase/long-chain-fatty-acid--[acyl-carrier-protein] ligase